MAIFQYSQQPNLAAAYLSAYTRPAPARDRSEGIKNIFSGITGALDSSKRQNIIDSYGPAKSAEEEAAREQYVSTGNLGSLQSYLQRMDNAAYAEAQSAAAKQQAQIATVEQLKDKRNDLIITLNNLKLNLTKVANPSTEYDNINSQIDIVMSNIQDIDNKLNEQFGLQTTTSLIPTVTPTTKKLLINKATVDGTDATKIMNYNIADFEEGDAKAAANDKVAKHLTTTVGYDKAPTSHEEASKRTTLKNQLITNGFDKAVTDKINTTVPLTKEQKDNAAHTKAIETYKNAVLALYNSDKSIQADFNGNDFNSFKEGITTELNKNKDLSGKLTPEIKANIISKCWQELKKSKGN
jgi:hypothetical protein